MFKVVPDQLRISEGWVRCGHCSEVFDARSHFQPWSPAAQPPAASSAEAQERVAEAIEAVEEALEEVPPPVKPSAHQDAVPVPVAQVPSISGLPETAPEAPVSLGAMLVNPESDPLPLPDEEEVPHAVVTPVAPTQTYAVAQAPSVSTEPDSVLDEDVSFVREARRQAFWRQPLMRAVMAVSFLLLASVLVLQVAVHERDRLVALAPQLKPWLTRLCAPLDCTVEVPRQIESVVIDSSTFNKVRSDVFRLSFMLRNTSGLEVATPAVEITLTDMQDQPVVRRVFPPAEIGAGVSMPPKGEWNAVLNMGVEAQGVAPRVSGYRLLAFYP